TLTPRVVIAVANAWPLLWGATGLIFCLLIVKCRKDADKRLKVALGALVFLLSYLFILSFGRSITSGHLYIYTQFRYQFVANLLLFVILGATLTAGVRDRPVWVRGVLGVFLVFCIATNAALTRRCIRRLGAYDVYDQKLIRTI